MKTQLEILNNNIFYFNYQNIFSLRNFIYNKNMRITFYFIYLLILLKEQKFFCMKELSFTYDVKGTLVKEEIVDFPSGKRFISFRHEGGFETSIARYGFYFCTGSILYNRKR